ncbi:22654_t:CDS:1 [Cetraspora pellucida]|uniref:22654_t:CDS:1 n=1 Tax=Cetraspora pellucida TaxID=1433469 RepID=A0A9N8Z8S1_9GLOM|nr:22654_t:CDS:1 [Cetraspora pellucida]
MIHLDYLQKVYRETYNTARVLSSGIETWENCFTRILYSNKGLTEKDKKIIQEWSIDFFEQRKERDESGKPMQCSKCNSIKYSYIYCKNCMKKKLESQFRNWTSGNRYIDDCIQRRQSEISMSGSIIEWIPFDQFEEIEFLAKGGFSKVYTARWTKGSIDKLDEENECFIRTGTLDVVLKSLNDSEQIGEEFIKEVIKM